jgi:HPt (histidine-containing phosphotransfer) domain-containing protein
MTTEINDAARESVVNLSELLVRVDNDRELLRDLMVIFKDEFPGQLQALEYAVRKEDTKQVINVSHSLRGMLSSMAVTKAAATLGKLEEIARAGQNSSLKHVFNEFSQQVEGLLSEVDTYIPEVQR